MTAPDQVSLPAPARRLELYVEYHGSVREMAFGRIPRAELAEIFASGRIGALLLEAEIATVLGLRRGTQGASPDLFDPLIGTIQCKTYRATPNRSARVTRGRHAGKLRMDVPRIWTTKSGYWDRRSRMTEADHADAESYFERYDAFMYTDISRMRVGDYSFVTIPSSEVIARKDGYLISEGAIRELIVRSQSLDEPTPLSLPDAA